jgi:hypothetical protein
MDETTTTTTTGEDTSAASRIRQLVNRVKELEGEVAKLNPVAAEAEKWRLAVDEAKASSAAERAALKIEREIMAAGILDAEGLDYVQHAYGKLPADARPPLAEWLANRDALPKAVRAYLSEPTATTSASAAAATQVAITPAPRSSIGTVASVQSTPDSWTPEAIGRLSPAEFRANRDAIMAALRTG